MKCEKPVEVFNFKDKTSQETFFNLTNETDCLTKIFNSNKSLDLQTKKFIKRVDGLVHQSFKKVKIESNQIKHLIKLQEYTKYINATKRLG